MGRIEFDVYGSVQNLIGRHIGDLNDSSIEWGQLWPVVDRDTLEIVGISDGTDGDYDLADVIIDGEGTALGRLINIGSDHACDVLVER